MYCSRLVLPQAPFYIMFYVVSAVYVFYCVLLCSIMFDCVCIVFYCVLLCVAVVYSVVMVCVCCVVIVL